jgi:predicted  nucleic acid-binding Zn-ribbon protein
MTTTMKAHQTMKTTKMLVIGFLLAALPTGAATVSAAAPETPLTAAGQQLEARYADQLKALQAEIAREVPAVGEAKKAAYLAAREAISKAEIAVNAAQQSLAKIPEAKEAIGIWKKYSLPDATKKIAEAREELKTATTDDARAAVQKTLAAQEERLASVTARLKAAEEEIAKSETVQGKDVQAKFVQASQAAQAALAQAQAATMQAVNALGLDPLLASDRLDASLVKFVVLFEATPRGLAEFAQQGAEQAALVDELLADGDLMKRMVMADGAAGGKYGRAMEIHTAIRKACPKAKEGVLQQLALAVALEHAVPVKHDNPAEKSAAPATVDPVKRYLAYEQAYGDGELDAAFKDLTAWDLRFVVNGDEPDETAAWGREMLRNYRPDIIFDPDYAWRYVNAVRTDVKYGSQDCQFDRPSLQNYQNIIMNGGVCGRRAFFGRFILRAFGIPTAARPQSGHGALIHWTPAGWVPCLGGGWGSGWTGTRYNGDLDFLATSQARAAGEASLLQVKRAQWIGDVVGEKRVFGFSCGEPGLWYGASLYRQMAIIEAAKAKTLAAVGTHLGEANESSETKAAAVVKAAVTDADKKVIVGANGVITIPAAVCSGVQPVKSFLGGLQAFCAGAFNCEVDVPNPGKYRLTARVVTVRDGGKIQLTANGSKDAVDIVIPYTCGQWEQTQPVEVTLAQGKNVLGFSQPERGFTLKAITLTPVK